MKKSGLYIFLIVSVIMSLYSCSDMNDMHDEYLVGGERIYIGKIDSLKTFAGDGRVKLQFWASDPRAKAVGFYWYPNNDSLFVDINHTSSTESFEVYIGGVSSTKTISEGNYTLKIITQDKKDHFSIPFEKIINIYGDRFRSTLVNRVLKSFVYQVSDASLSLTFSGPINDKEIGIEISYTDKDGTGKILVLADAEVTTPVKLLNVDKTKPVSYRTMFHPEPNAIDVFYASSKTITIP